MPGHEECARCHKVGGIGRPWLDADTQESQGSHGGDLLENRQLAFSWNGIRFSHSKHMEEDGEPVDCKICHAAVYKSTTRKDMKLPNMNTCVSCHTNLAKTKKGQQMRNCELCHLNNVE